MNYRFVHLKNSPEKFFGILPKDWQHVIIPNWKNFENTSSIYVFEEDNNIIAGGIVFKNKHPEISKFEEEFLYLYVENYFYLGFIWVIPEKRNQKLASLWLHNIKEINPFQKFWLTTEEASLKYFYEKNGFKLIAESDDPTYKEWIFTSDNS